MVQEAEDGRKIFSDRVEARGGEKTGEKTQFAEGREQRSWDAKK